MKGDHGHSKEEIARRLAGSNGTGRLRDAVYGGIDGAVTTFAIAAGVEGAGFSPAVIIALGIANVLADGFSMAAANYLGTKADLDDRRRLYKVEKRHIRQYPDGEREELRQIFQELGLSGEVLEGAVRSVAAKPEKWVSLMLTSEYGLAPAEPNPVAAALTTFAAFMAAGIVPLLPFMLGLPDPFLTAALATGAVFFGIGASKSAWSLAPWWKSGLETLLIGSCAAAVAYLAGSLFRA
ncbi:VIT1/CCC1 transporter family protein [Leisingera aquaemixtae]|uniref:VIT1/CCC1 transporter family protein n=1 Tax=Leisingera aquaemixtae TaxID=1396826 RepID=UPI001C945B7B|nr:VIT1/CCC1 transporter family protein [Leisingera aquaemixtae]MBY6069618.1 VIT1/CCC1 transporter family protein [Leisingera aquaemixtae]